MKCKITKIGTVIDSKPEGWIFNCEGIKDSIGEDRRTNNVLYCGWSVEELDVIANGEK